ncbi:hypothetical protein H4F99_09505 [Lysobacter sp. SG-8]|uniref:Uncharacterized protein n=1 Tax=Marilutibacter penaei TaxID=2759900 RepID=A0A7W3YEX5_9GAMM|nr:hypothetical protein [Lysobacter penaei]MBB1088725.1 hypothetical protein [Lysobacter penaei]
MQDAETGSGWLISLGENIAVPLQAPVLGQLVVDPGQPCQHMRVQCRPSGRRYLAGRIVEGWRYRDAHGRGPAGTSDGEVWVDPEQGAVLAYSGRRRGWDRTYGMEASTITYGALPDALFTLPESVSIPEGDAGR